MIDFVFNPDFDRSALETGSRPEYSDVIELFDNLDFANEVRDGNITHAMIRPKVGPEANNQALGDLEAADKIETMIQGLGYVSKFSYFFTRDAVKTFYGGGPEESMRDQTPIDPSRYESRWPEFIEFMTSGPATSILLHHPGGEAIQTWREHLGHWNIDDHRDPNTIRGALGVNKYNNLVHGSDEPAAVFKELDIIRTCLE